MDTRHLKSFLKIADLRSISRAADSLGISQPSLSQQLLRLEDEVGFKLFRRTARGVTVTEAGRIFQEHARHIVRNTEQALEDVRQLRGAASGQVIFAVPPSISRLIGVYLVQAVMKHAPQVSVRLVEAFTGNIRGWLEAGKVDLGILYDLGPLRHLSTRRLATEEMFLIGPPGKFGGLEDAPSIPLMNIKDYDLLLPGPQHGLRQLLDREAVRHGFFYQTVHEIDAISQIAALVSCGNGYSVLPLPAVADDLAAGKLSIARIGDGAVRRGLCLVRNPTQMVTHASVRVEDLTTKIMAHLIERGEWKAEPDSALR